MKVLIFAKRSILKNSGGPSGYIYNISEYLKSHPNDEIEFLPEKGARRYIWLAMIKLIMDKVASLFKSNGAFIYLYSMFSFFYWRNYYPKKVIYYFNTFDYIHCHMSSDVLRNFFPGCGVTAKIILTSHSPEPAVDEFAGMYGCKEFLDKHPNLRNLFLRRELLAYDIADHIMFPVKEAREPYELTECLYKKQFQMCDSKFFYVPTALNETDMITTNDHILNDLGIKDEQLKICYIGRHTEVKGYDKLKDVASYVWNSIPDAHFVIGGKQEPLTGLSDSRWHELGWVKTPSLLNEVDVFILYNKNTYFDLILLEILRQGTPVILTRTGGNKWFEDKGLKGLLFFNYGDNEELLRCVEKIKNIKETTGLEILKEQNRVFFKREFSMSLYIKRYLDNIRDLS